eukprot:72130-Amphidinium_carterae.1
MLPVPSCGAWDLDNRPVHWASVVSDSGVGDLGVHKRESALSFIISVANLGWDLVPDFVRHYLLAPKRFAVLTCDSIQMEQQTRE